MWLGFSHLFSYKCMYAGGVNFTSLLFMNVYSIYTFIVLIYVKRKKNIFFEFAPLCWWIDKKRKRYFGVWYMHVCLCLFLYAYVFKCLNLLSFTIGIKSIFCWYWYQEHILLFCWYQRVFVGIKNNTYLRTCLF